MNQKHLPSALAIEYFLSNFPVDMLIDNKLPENKIEEMALFYFNHLIEVLSVFDRLIRYEKYFKNFMPPDGSGIGESEAILYHLRSYIQDFYILKERIRKIVEFLIKDLPNYGIANEEDIGRALLHLSDQIHNKFKNINSDIRRRHVHEKSFSELDIEKANTLNSMLTGETPILSKAVNKDDIQKKYNEILGSVKERHQKQSAVNSENLRGMKEWFVSRFIHLFSSINGHEIKNLELYN